MLALLLAASLQDPPASDARALFDRMVEKLQKAKSVQFRFTVTGHRDFKCVDEGRWDLAGENRQRLQFETKSDEGLDGTTYGWISDGQLLREIASGRNCSERPAPPTLNAFHLRQFAYGGLRKGLLDALPELVKPDSDDFADFKLLKKEKVGASACRALSYVVRLDREKTGKAEQFVTLWIDEKTGLPAKRSVARKAGGPAIVERYSAFELDKAIDGKLFKLP